MKPDSTAVRVALWRALHVEVDAPPHVLEDVIGLQLAAPDEAWRQRGDMHPEGTRRFRASIVARARFIEDRVVERGVPQYVILGAGLDTFAQRTTSDVAVFEVDQPETQAWKRQRLAELGLRAPHFVAVDFEAGISWLDPLVASGFDPARPAVFSSTGVSMYLTRDAISDTMRQISKLAPGTVLAMSFLLPFDMLEPEERPGMEMASAGARKSGTPFISFFAPQEMLDLALHCGFHYAHHVSARDLETRYFSGRPDALRPGSEELLIAEI